MRTFSDKLTNQTVLSKNIVINLIGQLLPIGAAVFSIPVIIEQIGNDRFGLLALAWMLIGYFSLFDLGIGRAVTKIVAKKLGKGEGRDIPALVWTSLFSIIIIGSIGGFILLIISPWILEGGIRIPDALRGEARNAILVVSLSVPLLCTTAALMGILEAQQEFLLVNYVRAPMGVFYFVGPLLVLPFSKSLAPVVGVIIVTRIIGSIFYFCLCIKTTEISIKNMEFNKNYFREIIWFGGWVTLSNLVSPIIVSLDRIIIAVIISTEAVAYYATPYELVARILVVSGAVVGVLFPAITTSMVKNQDLAISLFSRGAKFIAMLLFPVILIMVVFAEEGLALWLGNYYAEKSTRVFQILAIAVFLNSISFVPVTLLHGANRPDITAKIHVIELPIYLIMLYFFVKQWGIEGAGWAWILRIAADGIILTAGSWLVLRKRLFPLSSAFVFLGSMIAIFIIGSQLILISHKILFLSMILPVFMIGSWYKGFSPDEKTIVIKALKSIRTGFGKTIFWAKFYR